MSKALEMDRASAVMAYDYDVMKEDFAHAGSASSDIKKKCREIGLDKEIIRRIAVMTYEAEINIVIHSEGGVITVMLMSDRIEIWAVDKGPGIEDVELAMTAGYSTAKTSAREMGFGAGMGLPNMKKCCDEFVIESAKGESTRIKMVIRL
ncbi:ATP-binding protein [Acidaminobacter sp.]|uniref:ATP-binding protein n=1 Tax=Acidaminobacter sp. TaxID=1872102 RepID=UPI00256634F3|nr:ATP-binding protein [Acidaminobacter sp.]MDK9710850.1 anti-sigma regulatory factor [Acidaminobacter sp.]